MAKVYDATLNDLIGARPDDWAAYFARLAGIPPGAAESLDTDLATSVQADRVFRIDGTPPAALHLELEANPRLGIPRELMRYNTLIDHQFALPVETVLVLMRPKARATDQTGVYVRRGAGGNVIAEFRYHVERVWERSLDHWLAAGVGLAPLALLTDEASTDLAAAVDRLEACVTAPGVAPAVAQSVVSSSYILCGLRYDERRFADLFQRFSMTLEDSTSYQFILAKGEARGVAQGAAKASRALLLHLGGKRYGPPAAKVAAEITAVTDAARLQRLAECVLDANGWDELLQTP